MKTLKITIFFLLILVLSVFGEFRIAKDRTPGGLYVVGPDISPDSSEGQFLYYSPDAGTTLVVKDSAEWGGIPWSYSAIAADYTIGNVYKVVLERLYHSNDYGETWTFRISDAFQVIAGFTEGENYVGLGGCFLRMKEYGIEVDTIPPPAFASLGCLGWQRGEIFLIYATLGRVFYSNDTLTTCSLVHDFGYHGFELSTSGRTGEVYLLSTDSIFYSADYGSTFVGTNTFSLEPEESSLMEIVGGGFSGELYGVYVDYYTDEYYEQRGGSIRICYSRDYGATFTCLKHTADGITYDTLTGITEVSKPEYRELEVYPNPFNISCKIIGIPHNTVKIHDAKGNLIEESKFDKKGSFIWYPSSQISSGIYLFSCENRTGKAILIK